MTADTLLGVKDLSVYFESTEAGQPAREVVKNVSFECRRGSFTSLVGPSGSGKTVTALSICRLMEPARVKGSVLWQSQGHAQDILRISPEELRKIRGAQIAYIFQDPTSSFNPVMKTGAQVVEALRAHALLGPLEARRKVLQAFGEVRLKDPERVFDAYPHELSGGMRQRAMVAMALVSGPACLIADEPTTSLDRTIEADILRLLSDLRRSRAMTILFITHDLELAAEYSDAIMVMDEGRIIERMSKKKNGFVPEQPLTKTLFAASLTKASPKTRIEV